MDINFFCVFQSSSKVEKKWICFWVFPVAGNREKKNIAREGFVS